jgi:hypothetical protein
MVGGFPRKLNFTQFGHHVDELLLNLPSLVGVQGLQAAEVGRSLFNSDKVILLVDSLYAEAMEAVKSHAALSASTLELISILGDNKFEARL